MSNVPPTVANYRQRAGRAGRRAAGTAFILTWANDRPHDQAYYNNPTEIISGEVSIPYLMLNNEYILQRHINAILLSNFLRYRNKCGSHYKQLRYCREFFDFENIEEPHIQYLEIWKNAKEQEINAALEEFGVLLGVDQGFIQKHGLSNFIR